MKNRWILVGILLLFSFAVAAESDFPAQVEALAQQLQGHTLPGMLGKLLGDQRANIHITSTAGEELIVGVVMDGKKVKSVVLAEVKEPTLQVYTTQATVESIVQSPQPAAAIQQALKAKHITYKAKGLGNKLKFSLISLFSFLGKQPAQQASVEVIRKEEASAPEKKEKVTGAVVNPVPEAPLLEQPAAEVPVPEATGPEIHAVEMVNSGFSVDHLTIPAGDKVVWSNVRSGRFQQAMIIGTLKCSKVKSKFFNPGESYEYTFTQPLTCDITDGILTTQKMVLVVE